MASPKLVYYLLEILLEKDPVDGFRNPVGCNH